MISKVVLLKHEYPKIIAETSLVVFVALFLGASDLLIAFLVSTLLYIYARTSEISYEMIGLFSFFLIFCMALYLSMTSGLEPYSLFDFDRILDNKKVLTIYVSSFLLIQAVLGYMISWLINRK